MKHISFDESTVLNEFARIASEQGFIKKAQDDMFDAISASPEDTLNKLDEATGRKYDLAGLLKTRYSIMDPENMQKLYQKLQVLMQAQKQYGADSVGVLEALKRVKSNLFTGITPPELTRDMGPSEQKYYLAYQNANKMFNSLMGGGAQTADDAEQEDDNVDPAAAQVVPKPQLGAAGKKPANWTSAQWQAYQQQAAQKVKQQQLKQMLQPKASYVDEDGFMIVNAKDDTSKYYDVTGETGEQLVEKAHPGGGTKTELTHSKTDENLVETIVEQQKKDIEVATSVPKGTYAELMNLYGTLEKMGYGKHLDGLTSIIKNVATTDEIVRYTLGSLRDKLTTLGYKKSAAIVEYISKKKVVTQTHKKQAQDDVDPGILEYGGSMPGQDVGMTGPTGTSESIPTGREYEGTATQGVPGKIKKRRYKRSKGIRAFQVWFNSQIKGTPYAKDALSVDATYGPKTRSADKLVRAYGGRAAFERAMSGKRQPEELELPLEPLWTPEYAATELLQKRFGNLPLNKAPELVKAIKQWGRKIYNSGKNVWSPEQLPKEVYRQLKKKIDSITSEDVKRYIHM